MRAAAIAVTLLLYSLAPAACLAGVLEHHCAECPVESSCGHEEGCADDPCNVELGNKLTAVEVERLLPPLVSFVPVALVFNLSGADLLQEFLRPLPVPPREHRPFSAYPAKSFPLLI